MGDHILAYLAVLFFVFIGLWSLLHGVPGLLLYHKKVQARAKSGERYIQVYDARTRLENISKGQYGKPDGPVCTESAVFTYEKNKKGVRATAVNLLGEDNSYIDSGKIYTIKVSPFNPNKCYFPAYQLYQGCSIPAKIYIFLKRTALKAAGLMFIGIAWLIYISFIVS
jgi:hypothetical protein